jgi:hypothetical protein
VSMHTILITVCWRMSSQSFSAYQLM